MGILTRFRSALNAMNDLLAPPANTSSTLTPPSLHASNSANTPFDGASTGRRARNWNPTRLGPTTNLFNTLDLLVSRSRDQIRNDPWAASAIDNFESQVISTGIRPRWNIKNKARRQQIEKEWAKWSKRCDASGQSSIYGLQAIAAREIFEGGEVFVRMHTRPTSFDLRIPLQIQLMETEQLPLWRNSLSGNATDGVPMGNSLRAGIEFDESDQRVAYHFYKQHPGETMLYPMDGMRFMRVPAENIRHCYKPLRAGQLRGQPHLTAVLTLLYQLEQYNDGEVLRKTIQTMWAAFITKTSPDTDVVPIDQDATTALGSSNGLTVGAGVAVSKMESGTINELLAGEDIKFPTLPQDNDFASFMKVQGRRFAAAVGATYEQITGDLEGVTYSSIRAGLLDFRRKCEMFQHNVLIHQFCQPIAERWLKEAVLAGVLELPGYARDPDQYTDIMWTPSGWDWVDPLKDVQAEIFAIRAGLGTRAHSVAERGRDVAVLDEEWVTDRDRAHELDLVYDTDPSQVLTKGARNPTLDENGVPIVPPAIPGAEPAAPGTPKPKLVPKKAALGDPDVVQ